MPPLPAASQIMRCVYQGTVQTTKWVNVFHVRYAPGPPVQADVNALATALRGAWVSWLASLCHVQTTLTSVTVTDLTSNLGLIGSNATSAAGTVGMTAPLPASAALVLSWSIPRRYRGGHPRMYVPGQIGGSTQNVALWSTSWTATATTQAQGWISAVNAITSTSMTTIQLVNLSYYNGHALRPTPLFDTITGVKVHQRIDTMRRRLGKEI